MTDRNIFWAIRSESHGFYCGTWLTRVEAIAAHVDAHRLVVNQNMFARHLSKEQAKDWRKCRRNGDRAVCVVVTELGQ